jgi:hypothetical protein
MGVEGKARREILLLLIDQGFIRIRRYKNHWKVNIKDLHKDTTAQYLFRWAKSMIEASDEPLIEVFIEQSNGDVIKTDLKTLATHKFAGKPKNWIQAIASGYADFRMIDEVESGPDLP